MCPLLRSCCTMLFFVRQPTGGGSVGARCCCIYICQLVSAYQHSANKLEIPHCNWWCYVFPQLSSQYSHAVILFGVTIKEWSLQDHNASDKRMSDCEYPRLPTLGAVGILFAALCALLMNGDGVGRRCGLSCGTWQHQHHGENSLWQSPLLMKLGPAIRLSTNMLF